MSSIILSGKIREATHSVPDAWVLSRLIPWMFQEAQGANWWVCVLTAEGKFLERKDREQTPTPSVNKRRFAQDIARYLNRECNFGGVWIAAWFDHCSMFYLLWKDRDGDLQIPIEVNQPWAKIRSWSMEVWAEHASQAYATWHEWMQNMELARSQQVNLAQGERLSQEH